MLRVSDFCRGPLSPVPSSGSRRRRRPSFDHSDEDDEGASDTNSDDKTDVCSVDKELQNCDEEQVSCLVRLKPWNPSLSTSSKSAACARISLDVLKGLSLRDGDCAFLEKHEAEAETTHPDTNTLLQKIAIRLQLMDEDEERELFDSPVSNSNNNNNICLVPPIVLANLGIPPQTMWQQQQSNDGSLALVEEQGTIFRLCAIHEENEDSSSDGGSDEGFGLKSSPWQIAKGKSALPAKEKVARRVLLRPLGKAPLWPWFSLTPPVTKTTKGSAQKQQSQDEGNDDGNSSINSSSSENPKESQTTKIAPTATEPKKDDNQVKDDVWIYPSRSGVILQESTLCEVRYKSNSNSVEQSVCYYEVLKIFAGEDDDNKEESLNDEQFYITAPCTQFELDSKPLSNLSFVRRLPLPSPFAFHGASATEDRGDNSRNLTSLIESEIQQQSTQLSDGQTDDPLVTPRKLISSSAISPNNEDETTSEELVFSCHPDWKKVASALLDAPLHGTFTSNMSNVLDDSRIIHLIGTDMDHDLETCVTTAASMVGMQCLSIKGLAAFGYEQRRSKGGNEVTGGVTVRSPMIEQQLAGIDAALEYIVLRRMEPCVLHLVGVDEELASAGNDDQLRCQIEDRFWSKWTEAVTTSYKRILDEDSSLRRSHRDYYDLYAKTLGRLDYCYTPRILIVISTKAPLKMGPWLERLIFPSITMSVPDDRYIHFLWNTSRITKNDSDEISNERNQECKVLLTEKMMPLLRGRPVQEIVQLQQQISVGIIGETRMENCDDELDLSSDGSFQRLEKLCRDFDAGRRKASSDVSRISSVSWADVGGLDHVRAEILDAIELPLKHPHLFPPNTGRSGILLFGPPGTGKTLVAKAVAKECRLPFLSVKGPELLGSYIGESEANIRKVFSSARLAAENNLPTQASILFFDELDSLAPKRGGNSNHGGGVMERVVASLLAELDGGGKESCGRVFVLGATNRPDLLDPSLLRPGRLDRLVYLGIPTDDKERIRVLASQLQKMKLEGDAMQMAKSIVEEGLPPRLSGADMSKLSTGAMLYAIRRRCEEADKEQERFLKQQEREGKKRGVTIDEILERWCEEQCTPVITLDDLRLASKDVSPSVSEEELQRYERLRLEHETSSH